MTPSNWRTVRAGDAAEIVTGATPSRREPAYWAAKDGPGHMWAAISDLRDRYVVRTAERITDAGVENSSVKLIPPGTPVMSFKLTIGRVSVAAVPIYTNEAIAAFIPKQGVDAEFLRYVLPRAAASSTADVAIKGKTLNREKLLALRLPLPPLDEQLRIAATLRAVDDAIAGGEAVVEQLDRVRRDLREAALGGGADAKELSVGELLEGGPRNGLYKPADKIGRGTLIAGMTAIQDAGVDWRLCRRAEVSPEELVRFGLHPGDLLVTRVYARVDGVGRFIRVVEPPEPAVYESNMMRIRVRRDQVLPEFLAEAMAARASRKQIEQRATLAAQASLNSDSLRAIRLRVPPISEQERVVEALDAVADRRDKERALVAARRRMKAALADALLTGKIRVPTAQVV